MTERKLDKFYTKPEVVETVIQYIDFEEYKTILEPSAGSGNFSNILQNYGDVIAIDIKPDSDDIIQANFLEDSIILDGNTLVIGNPPFGRQCSLALKFFNKAASYPEVSTIAFILPKSFKKESLQDKLDRNFSLYFSLDIENSSFLFKDKDYDVPSVFQIWHRTSEPRPKTVKRILNEDMSFVKFEDINESVIALRRVGVYAGKASYFDNQSKQSHYFLKVNSILQESVIEYLNNIIWEHNDTTGPRSISKQQFIEVLNLYRQSEVENTN